MTGNDENGATHVRHHSRDAGRHARPTAPSSNTSSSSRSSRTAAWCCCTWPTDGPPEPMARTRSVRKSPKTPPIWKKFAPSSNPPAFPPRPNWPTANPANEIIKWVQAEGMRPGGHEHPRTSLPRRHLSGHDRHPRAAQHQRAGSAASGEIATVDWPTRSSRSIPGSNRLTSRSAELSSDPLDSALRNRLPKRLTNWFRCLAGSWHGAKPESDSTLRDDRSKSRGIYGFRKAIMS